MEGAFRLPSSLDLHDDNLADSFRKWKRQMEVYLLASGASAKPKEVQAAVILSCAGPQVIDMFDQLEFAEGEQKDDPKTVMKKLEEACSGKENEVLQTYRFWKIPLCEPFDVFLMEIRKQADLCNFADRDRMLRDKIVFATTGRLQEALLRESSLTMKQAIDLCHSFEAAKKSAHEMGATARESVVQSVSQGNQRKPAPKGKVPPSPRASVSHAPQEQKSAEQITCLFCGKVHARNRRQCPAWNKTCAKCGVKNHFAKCCRQNIASVSQDVDDSNYDEEVDTAWLAAIEREANSKHLTAQMIINSRNVQFQLDSAADVNTLCQRFVKREQVRPTSVKLTMWNKTVVTPLGQTTLTVTNPKTGASHDVLFIVVPNKYRNLLIGLETVQSMKLLQVDRNAFVSNVTTTELGDLGVTSLTVDKTVTPKALPCRTIPLALQADVKEELDRLVSMGVLEPVTEPTPWCSQMAVVKKPSGKIRVCIDPGPLNQALQREYYKLPTLDQVQPRLQGAKVFSKLDVKDAFWHVRLDDDSSKLTAMSTPYGRYIWKRLPFGLKVSSEIFQRKLLEAIGDLDVICVADDIVICGCGTTRQQAEDDHNRKLSALKRRCEEKNIVLNDNKTKLMETEVTFLGHRIGKEGIRPDPAKVEAILSMEAPSEVSGVKRFCGMVQYLSRFLPNLADDVEPLRALTKKNVEWSWTDECQAAFESVKVKVTSSPVLGYYCPEKELVLQVDSSEFGLGAALLQDGRPLEYASRLLTPAERNWAQMEKELLSVVFGLKRFHQYTFGRQVLVINDHKPLEAILKKPLDKAPKRLQNLMLQVFQYDAVFKYEKGETLHIADFLSRAPMQSSVHAVEVEETEDGTKRLPDTLLEEVKKETEADPDMSSLLECIRRGWPTKKDVPPCLQPYFSIRDRLSCQDALILMGERILIPPVMRSKIKKKLHSAHMGADSMIRRANHSVFWPGLRHEVKANGRIL